ncbi:squalene/phytoene synthase family protein [Gemmatimonadota bacterium]
MMGKRDGLNRARDQVREKLQAVAENLSLEGLPLPALEGKLLRPLSAFISVPSELRDRLDQRFWYGALAVEMVHEASLLHDDILDEAPQRRGKPTMVANAGVGPALVMGDHLLTAAYRAAAAAESPDFLQLFIRSVERTVAGEIAQERSQGRILEEPEYHQIITGKSGELFRTAFSLAPAILGITSSEGAGALGARFGALYQMVDDFLDYCTEADRGKGPFQDYRQGKWTWPLSLIEASGFDAPHSEIRARLFKPEPGTGQALMETGARRMAREFDLLIQDFAEEGFEVVELRQLLGSWEELILGTTAKEVGAQATASLRLAQQSPSTGPNLNVAATRALRRELRLAAGGLLTSEDRLAYFGKHAKSFRFAARLFPREQLLRVADVYAFCRFTDDLVDEAADEDREITEARLNLWLSLAREAFEGEGTGISLLDDVMGETRESGVPFHYVEELVEGVRMDLTNRRFRSLEELRVYSYRVASVVGGWLTELFGIRDPWVLDRAFALGHAMQLTNILRDVGEDLHKDRLYLPEDMMARHGVDRALLKAKAENGSPAFPGYKRVLDELMAEAEADYEKAFEGIPTLPPFFRAPVAVAANVYRGIHREIRRNGYDNLGRRASTSLPRKIILGVQGLMRLRRPPTGIRPERSQQRVPLPPFTSGERRQAAS